MNKNDTELNISVADNINGTPWEPCAPWDPNTNTEDKNPNTETFKTPNTEAKNPNTESIKTNTEAKNPNTEAKKQLQTL